MSRNLLSSDRVREAFFYECFLFLALAALILCEVGEAIECFEAPRLFSKSPTSLARVSRAYAVASRPPTLVRARCRITTSEVL